MVSILAQEVFNETQAVTANDGDTIDTLTEINDLSTTTSLGGFTYLEKVVFEPSFDTPPEVFDNATNGKVRFFTIEADLTLSFNGFQLFVSSQSANQTFTYIDFQTPGSPVELPTPALEFPLDVYVDDPLTIEIPTSGPFASSDLSKSTFFSGDVNTNFNIVVTLIGRQP